jgi:hypothetical protein
MPLEPIVGASALIKGQSVIRGAKSKIRSRDYNFQKMLSLRQQLVTTAGGLVLRAVRFVGRWLQNPFLLALYLYQVCAHYRHV